MARHRADRIESQVRFGLGHSIVVLAEHRALDLQRLGQQLLGLSVLPSQRQDIAQARQSDRMIGIVAAHGGLENLDRLPFVLLGQRQVVHPGRSGGKTTQRDGYR